jgi:hypothetical protein
MAEYEKFTIDKGSDVAIQLELVDNSGNPKDLNNYSAEAKMKRNYNSDSDETTDFSIAIVPDDGVITLSLTNAQTDALKIGNYVYDVEISYVDSNAATIVERVLEGKIRVSPSVTT